MLWPVSCAAQDGALVVAAHARDLVGLDELNDAKSIGALVDEVPGADNLIYAVWFDLRDGARASASG